MRIARLHKDGDASPIEWTCLQPPNELIAKRRPERPPVAVGMPVARHPPHRSPRAVLPHEALILDVWRQSELGGMDEEHAVGESNDQPVCATAAR